ncbi:hypothetical protein AXG93_3105s1440 [Marchantia polymorpha subsp. ruderalis]|uniref:Uncharacterized protein n=1 Tax=Marchantia polymorpha subsp. ruderalis TaxID=1480154 RepID=A0A176WLV9_MARPO|nr:hypothetical protein AXG93_3105s1440 [Marchantia polymorpha subsp. ruderalis]
MCFASEQVPFDNSTSGQEPSAQRTLDEMPLAQAQLEKSVKDEGRKEETRVPSAQSPLAVVDLVGEAELPEAKSPTALDILAWSGVAVTAAEATQPNSRESSRISVAIEILDSEDEEDESSSEEQEVESVQEVCEKNDSVLVKTEVWQEVLQADLTVEFSWIYVIQP